MKKAALLPILAAGWLLTAGGCGHLEVTSEGPRNRVLTGTISAGGVALPEGTEIAVRLVAPLAARLGQPGIAEQPVARPTGAEGERIIGEQVQKLAVPAREPVAFRIEYEADDALLRRGVNLEARVYYQGRVRFRTIHAQVVTLSSSAYPQAVVLQPVER